MELIGGCNHRIGFKNLIEVLDMMDLISREAETSQQELTLTNKEHIVLTLPY